MPFDGSGNFNRVMNWVSDATAGIKIVATRHDSEDDNLAAGLSNTLTKDGQSQPTANIPMNGKRLTNLGAPSAATDAATKAYADAVRTFNTAITLTGANPQARIGCTFADVSFGAREAGAPAGQPNRFVWNSAVDFSGTDIGMLDDTGKLFLGGTNMPAATTRSSLTVPGDITFQGSGFLGFNTYWDGSGYRAAATGWSSDMLQNQSTGDIILARSAGSVAANAAQTLSTLLQFSPTRGTMHLDTKFEYGDGASNVYNQFRGAQGVGFYRKTGTGNFSWNKSADGLQSGSGLTPLMTLDDGGDLSVALGSVLSITTGSFVGTASVAVLATSAAGTLFLRPNGRISVTGQSTIDSTGNLAVAAAITSGGIISTPTYLQATGVNLVLGPTGAGTVFMRPNGIGSTVGQATLGPAGDLTVNGGIATTTGTGITSGGSVTSSQNFGTTSANALLGGDGTVNGGVYLRPRGIASSVNQAIFDYNGNMTIAGPTGTKSTGTTWANPSDVRLKENIVDYGKGLAELLQVRPRQFTFKASPQFGECYGVIAQEIEGVFPETVKLTEGEVDGKSVTDLRSFDASALTFALINAVKELSDKLDAAATRIASLEARA